MTFLILFILIAGLAGNSQAAGGHQTVELDGMIEARQIVEIRTPVEGIIKEIPVERGDTIEKGQVLVVLESGPENAAVDLWRFRSEMEAATKAAEARLEYSIRKEKRMQDLYSEDLVSLAEKEEAEAERQLAAAQVYEAQENKRISQLELKRAIETLNMRTIRSPFSGIVAERSLHPGAVATTNDKKPILKLAETGPLSVEVIAPANFFGLVREGARIEVIPEVPRGVRYVAVVSQVDRIVDAASGTFAIRAELPNSKVAPSAGVRCKVRVSLR